MIPGRIKIAAAIFLSSTISFAKQINSSEPEAVPGEYLVQLKKGTEHIFRLRNADQKLSVLLGAQIKSKITEHNIVFIKKPAIELRSSVIENLQKNELVEFVEPNFIYRINKTPNDPLLTNLWGMKNLGQKDSSGGIGITGLDIEAEKAWDIETGSKDVIVAVIDTGIDYTNPDLISNNWTNESEFNGTPGVDDDNNGYVDDIHGYSFTGDGNTDPMDDHGHGSHCAGTIGASGNDGKGIVGVAWNVKLMGVKFLSASGSGSLEGALQAIDYATKMGAHIMSNSWGGGGFSQALYDAIERSHKAGVLFVAAAGNDGDNNDTSPHYPSNYQIPNVISVAAVDNKGRMASFTNYGKATVHVAAPGVNIFSSLPGEKYASWSGTSMATPHVSGIAALLYSKESQITNVEAKQRIMNTARPFADIKNKVKSNGLVTAYGALTNTQPPPDANDPSNWQSKAMQIESSHPYLPKGSVVFEVNADGANEFAIYFEKFETEKNYDFVIFSDKDGKEIGRMSGNNPESFSPTIKGSYVKITLTSDDSVEKYGFKATKIAFR